MPFVIPAEGGCQCGEIRYRLIGQPIFLGVCHCTDCKQQSGSAFGMSLRMRKADVELLQGAPKQWTARPDNGNPKICVFCGTCGTRLWNGPGPLGNLSVKPGTLDDPSQLAPRYEGWT
ncbi:MAG: GFA family protein, partial [Alphaproteobacteria bacterium]|nr:GFA family protein [Alphaproteobacteria bacterium]